MIDEKNLSRNIYQYFVECYTHKKLKSVMFITNKQSVFYSQYDREDEMIHLIKILDVFNATHYDELSWFHLDYRNNLYFASEGKNLHLFLPDNKSFTFFQYEFIQEMLDLVEQFEQEFQTKVKIRIVSFKPPTIVDKPFYYLSEFREEMKKMLTKEVDLEREIILGKTLDSEKIKESILFSTGLLECQTKQDLLNARDQLMKFYQDEFYHEECVKLFPDFLETNQFPSLLLK